MELAWRGKRTDADDIELKSTLQELALNLGRDAVETDMALGVDGLPCHGRHCGSFAVKDRRERMLPRVKSLRMD
jgi:hypothetical protein